ncbi:hypothetical protein AAOGI_37030 [Agarivorans albus]
MHNRQQVKDAGRSLSYPVLRAKVEEFDMGTEFDICIVPSVSTLLSSGVFLVFGISVFSSFLFWKLFFGNC